jgi:hypothetical protein
MGLIMLADYFCVERLTQICSNELTTMIGIENVEKIMNFSSQFKNLSDLSVNCSDFWIKQRSLTVDVGEIESSITKKFKLNKNVSRMLVSVFERIKFDLAQNSLENEKIKQKPQFKKGDSNS